MPYKSVWQGVAFAKHKDYQSFKRTVVIPIIKPTTVSRFKGDIQGDLASFYQISVSGTVAPWKSEGHQGTFVASEVVSCDFSGPHVTISSMMVAYPQATKENMTENGNF